MFGESKIDDTAAELGLKVLGKIPIVPEMAQKADEGKFDDVKNNYIETAIETVTSL